LVNLLIASLYGRTVSESLGLFIVIMGLANNEL
jgi:hypothetical protein